MVLARLYSDLPLALSGKTIDKSGFLTLYQQYDIYIYICSRVKLMYNLNLKPPTMNTCKTMEVLSISTSSLTIIGLLGFTHSIKYTMLSQDRTNKAATRKQTHKTSYSTKHMSQHGNTYSSLKAYSCHFYSPHITNVLVTSASSRNVPPEYSQEMSTTSKYSIQISGVTRTEKMQLHLHGTESCEEFKGKE